MRLVTLMTHNECLHEEQIQGQSRKIEALETRSDYKEDTIKELKEDMKELKSDIKELKEDINDFLLKSVNDDSNLKEILSNLTNRVTALETRADTQEKDFKTWLAIITLAFGAITIYFNFIH